MLEEREVYSEGDTISHVERQVKLRKSRVKQDSLFKIKSRKLTQTMIKLAQEKKNEDRELKLLKLNKKRNQDMSMLLMSLFVFLIFDFATRESLF